MQNKKKKRKKRMESRLQFHRVMNKGRDIPTRQFQPIPPCSKKPPKPTSGQWPPANINPYSDIRRPFNFRPVVDGETRAVFASESTSINSYLPKSIRMASSRTLHAAQEWPPDRTDTLHLLSDASWTALTISSSFCGRAIARGYRAGRRWLNTRPTLASS